jgi:uncharacterized membrane protein
VDTSLIWKIIQALLFCGFPALVHWGAKRWKVIDWVGPVVLCYLFGILLVNVFRFPVFKPESSFFAEITVALAIPLLLFSTNFYRWLRLAKKTALSIGVAFASVLLCSSAASFLLAGRVDEPDRVAGMLVGVYTGGTPNMSAIGMALSVEEETFILINAVDVVLGAIYLIFLMSVAQKLLGRFLPAFQKGQNSGQEFYPEKEPGNISPRNIFSAAGLAVLIVGTSIGLAFLLTGEMTIAVVILAITTLAIASSFNSRVRNLHGSYETGQYILLIFCVAIGTLADAKELLVASGHVFLFVGIAMFGAVFLHYSLAALFRIDVDTTLITSTGAIYGPAFVGPIAGVLKNREAVVSGLTSGLLGYALGNYLGIGLAMILKFIH